MPGESKEASLASHNATVLNRTKLARGVRLSGKSCQGTTTAQLLGNLYKQSKHLKSRTPPLPFFFLLPFILTPFAFLILVYPSETRTFLSFSF
jgi:hypothetical protein